MAEAKVSFSLVTLLGPPNLAKAAAVKLKTLKYVTVHKFLPRLLPG